MNMPSTIKLLAFTLCATGFATPLLADDAAANILSPGDQIVALKQTVKGKANTLSGPGDFGGMEGNDEPVSMVIDGDTNSKHLNKTQDGSNAPGVNTGFAVVPKAGASVVTAIQFVTANDAPERDPLKITVEGSNNPKATETGTDDFKLIYEGTSGLENTTDRNAPGEIVKISNKSPYLTYRVLITATRGGSGADGTQYSEVKLMGSPASAARK